MSAPAQVTESKSPAFRNIVEPLEILLTDVSGDGVCDRILNRRSRDAILEPSHTGETPALAVRSLPLVEEAENITANEDIFLH
jgi:hypothetical protein